jgi:plastocyanin
VVPEYESAIAIPTDIRFLPGEVPAITVKNEDVVAHRAGPFLVGAGQSYTQRFPKPGTYPIACAVDPAESIVVTVEG